MQTFKSKMDAWLVLIIGVTILVSLVATLATAAQGRAVGMMLALLIFLLGCVLPLWTLTTTRYDVSDDAVNVRCGPFTWSIARADITSLQATHNPLSSPALSLDRLKIHYGQGKWIMVSPADKQAFAAAIGHNIES